MRRARRRARLTVLASVAAVAVAGWAVLAQPPGGDPAPTRPPASAADPAPARPAAPRADVAWMLDPTPALGTAAAALADAAPPTPAFRTAAARSVTARLAQAPAEPVAVAPAPVREPVRVAAATPAALAPARTPVAAAAPGPVAAPVAALVPLPVARPPELRRPQVVPATRVAGRQPLPRTRDVFRAAMAEEPSFLERLFGGGPAEASAGTTGALAYADPDAVAAPRPRLTPAPSASPSAGTAVYDITAGTVTLPGGDVLEAHSGYGAMMDDPRYVHVRMRGPTPPGTYELTERERPFHGVRAIRMTPVGGSGAIHGRDGILAHTYMLRQAGASNGCVVFRDYPRFLNAFLRGEVRRMVVVAGGRGDFFGSARRVADR